MGIGSSLKKGFKKLDPTRAVKSLNEERKRVPGYKPIADFWDKNFMSGGNQGKETERDMAQRQKDMEDYIQFGPQEGRPTFSLAEIKAGPAGSLNSGNEGDLYGQTSGVDFDASDPEGNPDSVYWRDNAGFDPSFWEGVDIGEDSWLSGQLGGTANQQTPDQPFQPGQSMQQPMAVPDRIGGADFSMRNPFAGAAKNIGFSDFQNYKNQTRAPSGKPGQQQAQAAALRGSIE